jgi:hypothetical protein
VQRLSLPHWVEQHSVSKPGNWQGAPAGNPQSWLPQQTWFGPSQVKQQVSLPNWFWQH